MKPDLSEELDLAGRGFRLVAGLDEAGRGALAGPVVAGAVVLPLDSLTLEKDLDGVQDSKTLTPAQREMAYATIREIALAVGVGIIPADTIDHIGIVAATRAAMREAISELASPPDALIIDYLTLPDCPLPQRALPKADSHSLSVAAASIVAKVTRDRIMVALETACPGYGFAQHKGYGTPQHLQAIAQLGPSPVHRLSFAPVRNQKQDSLGQNQLRSK